MNATYVPWLVSSLPKDKAPIWGLLAVMLAGLGLLVDARLSDTSTLQAAIGVGLAVLGGLGWSFMVIRRWLTHSKVLNLLVESELVALLKNPKHVGLSHFRVRKTLTRRYPGWPDRASRRGRFEESY